MKRHLVILIYLLAFRLFADNCIGEVPDGPGPLLDVSSEINTKQNIIKTQGVPQEFLVWENKQALVYRNEKGQVRQYRWQNGAENVLTSTPKALTRFLDPKERYLLTENQSDNSGPAFFDLFGSKKWIPFAKTAPPLEHLFIHNQELYSLGTSYTGGDQHLKLYRYNLGDDFAVRVCPELQFNVANGYLIGKGHFYPNVLLYQTTKTNNGTLLKISKLNVNSCYIQNLRPYTHLIQGDVDTVQWFEDNESIAVKINNAPHRKNLLWDYGNQHCNFYDVGDGPIVPMHPYVPAIGSWSQREGFRIFWLHEGKTATLLPPSDNITYIGSRDVWMTADSKTLLINPHLQSYDERALMKMTINKP